MAGQYDRCAIGVGTAGALLAVQYTEGSRVMVRRVDSEAAEKFIAGLSGTDATAPIDDDTLAALADESKGWSDPSTGAVV